MADAANAALADLDAVSGALRSGARDMVRLRVAALHSLAYCWLIPRLQRFMTAQPHVRLNIETATSLVRFDEAGPDLAVRHGLGHWPGLIAHHLMDDALFPVAAPTLPGVADITQAAQIARLPLMTDLALQGWRDWFRAAGVRGVQLPAMHTFTDSTDSMLAAVYGLGAALARAHRGALPAKRRTRQIARSDPKARFAYYAVDPAHKRPTAAATAFIDWLRREATQGAQGEDSTRAGDRA